MMQHVLGDVVFKCRKKSRRYFSTFEISVLDNRMLSRPYSSLGFMYRFYKVTDTSGLRVNAVQTVQSSPHEGACCNSNQLYSFRDEFSIIIGF